MAKRNVHESPKVIWVILTIVVVIILAAFMIGKHTVPVSQNYMKPDAALVTSFDFGNQKISLNNQEHIFVKGAFKGADNHMAYIANRSVSPAGTRAAAVIADSPEGSGTFYYLVGATQQDGHEVYGTPISLGDRIKIVSISVANPGTEDNGIVTVKYLEPATNAPMAAAPTEAKIVKYALEENANLIKVLH